MSMLRWAKSVAVIVVLGLVTACGGNDAGDAGPAAYDNAPASTPIHATTTAAVNRRPTIEVTDNVFTPSTLRVKVGQTVVWEWASKGPHSVIGDFDGEEFNSGEHTGAEGCCFAAIHLFGKSGTYQYFCGIHGGGMSGTVIVE
jgi:plastocyanin